MPGRDQSGPNGMGPMTGRGFGNCRTENTNTNAAFGRGFGYGQGRGMGRARGFGFRNRFRNFAGQEPEAATDSRIEALERALTEAREEIRKLKNND